MLSESNTHREIEQKVQEYFAGGVRLVRIMDPVTETAVEYLAVDQVTKIDAGGSLSGRDVLRGFDLNLRNLFDSAGAGRDEH